MKIGIDALATDFPKIVLPMETFAEGRGLEVAKLQKGLGLKSMSFTDVHQDVVTLAANACKKLLEQLPEEAIQTIDRLYVGTESGIDSSKPVATFVLGCLQQVFPNADFSHFDVVDYQFACIGAVDALQNTLDYVRLHPDRKAIVVATDLAKYDLGSGGEYTQGAGAVALLIAAQPKLIAISPSFGVATQHEFDFFKPRQTVSKEVITNVATNPEWQGVLEAEVTFYKEQPVFDGQYSNTCYIRQIQAAYKQFAAKSPNSSHASWARIAMHLPYSFQGRRTFAHILAHENPDLLADQPGTTEDEKIRALTKTPMYLQLVDKKLAPAEAASGAVGNIYTGSIFLALASLFAVADAQNQDLTGEKVGFIAYGSGAKSKVFEGVVSDFWQTATRQIGLFEQLEQRVPIDFSTYIALHKKEQSLAVVAPKQEFVLQRIETQNPNKKGARYYEWKD